MFKNKKLASSFSRRISAAARLAMEDMTAGRVKQEPAVTDRLIAYIQREIRQARGFNWTAMTLTDRGKGSQEKKYGADFVGSLEINLDGFYICKGFLAQAKKVEPNDTFSCAEYDKLSSQCHDMLSLSSDSFVFLYSAVDGFLVLPALSVIGSRHCNPHELTTKQIQKFFVEHFECFIGDTRISLAHVTTLEKLYEEYRARAGFHLVIANSGKSKESFNASIF